MLPKPIIVLLSGGLDSTVLAYDLKQQGCLIHALLFNYGQIHVKELGFSRKHCDILGIKRTEIDLHRVDGLFKRSILTGNGDSVIVPNRNSVFVHIAASIAVSAGAESVAIGCNKDDQNDFPDCTWDWVESVNASLQASKIDVEIVAPYIGLTKRQIVSRAKEFGISLDEVWWCYGDGTAPCGKCMACEKMEDACA